jgi:hypothetical protein
MAEFTQEHVGQEVVYRGQDNEQTGKVTEVREEESGTRVFVAFDGRSTGEEFNPDDLELAGEQPKKASKSKGGKPAKANVAPSNTDNQNGNGGDGSDAPTE